MTALLRMPTIFIDACRACRSVGNRLYTYDKNVEQLEKTADEAVFAAREADRKFEEVIIFRTMLGSCLAT